MPTLKGRMFSPRPHGGQYRLIDTMGAGLGALRSPFWKRAGKSRALNRLDGLMRAARVEKVMVRNLGADDTAEPEPPAPQPEDRPPPPLDREAA